MTADRVEDSTRVVVDERHRGGVVPGSREEMWRDVYLVSGAAIGGPVWADRLQVEGPDIEVNESVYARSGIRVDRDTDTVARPEMEVTFASSVTTPESLTVRDTGFRTRIRSNVYAGTVHLERCVVYGNIYADRAIVRDSLVLGGVYSDGELKAEQSVLATFDVRAAQIGNEVSLLFPVAVTTESPELAGPVRVLCFCDLGQLMDGVDELGGSAVKLDRDDIHRIELPDRSDADSRETVYALSLNRRLLDLHELEDILRTNRKVLEELALLDHLPEARQDELDEERITRMEDTLLSLAVGASELSELEGAAGVEEVAERDDIQATLEMMHQASRRDRAQEARSRDGSSDNQPAAADEAPSGEGGSQEGYENSPPPPEPS